MCYECNLSLTDLQWCPIRISLTLNQCWGLIFSHTMKWNVAKNIIKAIQQLRWYSDIHGYWFFSGGLRLPAHIWRLYGIHSQKWLRSTQCLGCFIYSYAFIVLSCLTPSSLVCKWSGRYYVFRLRFLIDRAGKYYNAKS